MNLKQLQKLKDKLLTIDQNNQQLIGAKNSIMESFKEEFNLNSKEEVEEYIKKLKKEKDEVQEEIDELENDLLNDLKEEGILDDEED